MRVATSLSRLLAGIYALLWSCGVWAETTDCAAGQNIIAQMSEAERSALRARSDGVPFARGNLWTARKGDQLIHLVGTYHLADPRMDKMLARLTPLIDEAQTLLVEAGAEEEKALQAHIARDPSVLMVPVDGGQTIVSQLGPEERAALAKALNDRNIPVAIGSRFRPWYLSVLLAIPSCELSGATSSEGLDRALINRAEAANIPVRALEPYDTVFRIFADMSDDDQLSMIRTTLATIEQSQDFSTTMADAYFAEETRLIWELMRDVSYHLPGYSLNQVDAEITRMEEALINRRNRDWIHGLEAAAQQGPVFAAFGALHLLPTPGLVWANPP
jgi:uncharacterized protein YbaP (TraB family)